MRTFLPPGRDSTNTPVDVGGGDGATSKLEGWLRRAGVNDRKLQTALALCEQEEIESEEDLRYLSERGKLSGVGFKPVTLGRIEDALELPFSSLDISVISTAAEREQREQASPSEIALEAAVAEHSQVLAAQKAAHEERLHASNASEAALVEEHERASAQMEAETEAKIAALSAQHDAAIAGHEELVASHREEHAVAQAEQQRLHDEAAAKLHSQWEAKAAQREQASEIALEPVVAEHSQVLATQKAAHEERLHASNASEAALVEEHERASAQMEAETEAKIAALSAQHDAAIAGHEELVASHREEHAVAHAEQQRLHDEAVAKLHSEWEAKVAEMHRALSAQPQAQSQRESLEVAEARIQEMQTKYESVVLTHAIAIEEQLVALRDHLTMEHASILAEAEEKQAASLQVTLETLLAERLLAVEEAMQLEMEAIQKVQSKMSAILQSQAHFELEENNEGHKAQVAKMDNFILATCSPWITLDFSDQVLSPAEIMLISRIHKLDFADIGIGPIGLKILAKTIPTIPGLVAVDISRNQISAHVAPVLIESIQKSNIETLVIGKSVSIVVGGSDATSLDYSDQDLGPGEIMLISALVIPTTPGLVGVDISRNQINADVAPVLIESIKKSNIETLVIGKSASIAVRGS
eukprot:SAG11_NODE_3436_length_2448_cov_5.228608_1_plen_643_part_10